MGKRQRLQSSRNREVLSSVYQCVPARRERRHGAFARHSGSKTRLDWAGGMSLDPDRGDLYVANDVGDSILVFRETDDGDVAPARIINGDKTGLNHPAGISLDLKNQEFWVSNMGNSSATCYSLKADGNATPVRTIRSAPLGRTSVKFGKPQAVAYDSKREQYLVPN